MEDNFGAEFTVALSNDGIHAIKQVFTCTYISVCCLNMEILILPNVSDNLYAEIFLRTAGARFTPQGKSTGSTMRDGFIQVSQVIPAHTPNTTSLSHTL